MKRLPYLLFLILFFFNPLSLAQNHNSFETDLERVKRDITDLQKFVYKNDDKISNQTIENSDIENLKKIFEDISKKLTSLESQMNDMKDDISNLYLLYTSPEFDTNKNINSTNELNIDESISKIVSEKNNDQQTLGQLSLTELNNTNDEQIISLNENKDKEKIVSSQLLGELAISTLEEKIVTLPEPTDEDLSIINDLDQLMLQKQKELNKPVVDVLQQIQLAKQSLASLENQKAIESLLVIVESETKDLETLAEAYYLLGRTYFIEDQIIESVKYFGIRHRDLSDISKFKTESYFWLGKSLFSIGDQENGCLVMEDIIFSKSYLDNSSITDQAKNLQEEKDCGFIID